MGLIEFLANLPEDDSAPIGYAALAELSGIFAAETAELSRTLEEWRPERVQELFRRLTELTEEQAKLEFEVVFKAGLSEKNPVVRVLAVNGLAESIDRSLAGRLAGLLERDPDAGVRAAAATSMATLCIMATEGKLHRRDGELMRLALAKTLESASEEPEVKMRAMETAAIFGGDRVAAMIEEAHRSGDIRSRQSAIFAMGRTGDSRWLSAVIAELDAADASVRYEATVALGEIGGEEHANLLKGPLDDEDLEVQVAAVLALEHIGGPPAITLLKQALQSAEPSVKEAARDALEAIESIEGLAEVIGPDIQKRGDIFGGRAGTEVFGGGEVEVDDASEREGWGHLVKGQGTENRNGSAAGETEKDADQDEDDDD
ncbi:MAG: HEAT repeat domain-containing protein [Dehalococcoidia bacterium]|nr:HEAT repeat domain-containing protein [Dehalococcoidia bacterium]MSQ34621.1 HEAT repeat domain-containing protein [Dehalococcoidia bacterium]